MPKFAVKKIPLLKERTLFYTLVIDGVNIMEEYKADCESNSRGTYLKSCMSYISSISTGQALPAKTLKPMKGHKDCYRIRKDPLRLYYIKHDHGYIFILGSLKTNQDKEEKKLASLITQIKPDIEIITDQSKENQNVLKGRFN